MTPASYVWRYENWHPSRQRLARLRALYWIVVRRHETEICGRHGGPVRVVFHVPDELWARYSGFENSASGGGVLCLQCFDDLYRAAVPDFLRWACVGDQRVDRDTDETTHCVPGPRFGVLPGHGCGHPWASHSNGGICSGVDLDEECYCCLFPPLPWELEESLAGERSA